MSIAHVLQMQRSVGNRATSRVIQRYGGQAGVAGNVTLAAGTRLIHGSPVEQFKIRGGANPGAQDKDKPDVPAWFAEASTFSAHAGGRYRGAATHFHHFQNTRPLSLLAFDDLADMLTYLTNNGIAEPGEENGVEQAELIYGLSPPRTDGYLLERDAVRQEREIVLFWGGIRKITKTYVASMPARYRQEPIQSAHAGDLAVEVEYRTLLAGGQPVFEANLRNLGEFQKVGDKGRSRPRAFSSGSI